VDPPIQLGFHKLPPSHPELTSGFGVAQEVFHSILEFRGIVPDYKVHPVEDGEPFAGLRCRDDGPGRGQVREDLDSGPAPMEQGGDANGGGL
jgi:hypothetical protein